MLNSRMMKESALILSITFFLACSTNTTGPATTVPGMPTSVTATAGDGQVTVSWTAPASDGGSAITGYQATAVQDTNKHCLTTTATTCVVTGLSNGTAYTFTVTATNAIGAGSASSPSAAATPTATATVPGSPTLVTATPGDGQATVSWTAPTSDGGSAITGFQATAVQDTSKHCSSTSATSCVVTDLTNGNSYTFTVTANNTVGASAASLPSALVTPSMPLFSQLGSKLVGTSAIGSASQGYSVSLSSDGNTALIGGYGDSSNAGAAWVWTRSGGVWTQQGGKLVGTGAVGNAYQGWSVSLSSDGNTAIVGGYFDNGGAGAAWVWTRSGEVWTQQGSKLVGTGAIGSAKQGTSVSLSPDGNTAIVGGYSDNGYVGAAWVWTRSGGVWTQQGSKLVGTGAAGNAYQGWSVSLSSDGNTALVGGYGDSSNAGATWVWTRSGEVWTQQGSKLVGTGAISTAKQGASVSLSSDGNTALVGGYGDSSNAGAAWVWTRSGGVWTQLGSKLVGTDAISSGRQGTSVSLSSDGNTALVGGIGDNSNAGAAWIFTRP